VRLRLGGYAGRIATLGASEIPDEDALASEHSAIAPRCRRTSW
jgi:hypothetical protein